MAEKPKPFHRATDVDETQPTDIMLITPPPSAKRSMSPPRDVSEMRETYQQAHAKTKIRPDDMIPRPCPSYTPEVIDPKARASTDAFTPDDKAC